METRTFGRTRLTLPGLNEAGTYLSNVSSLETGRGVVQDFSYSGADLRELDLASSHLQTGRVTGLSAKQSRMENVRVDSVEFVGCDFGSVQWTGSRLSRVAVRDCRLMGAVLSELSMSDVLLEGCKLDYAALDQIRATGPVVFSRCILTEADFSDCNLGRAVFDDCQLRLTEFGRGKYTDVDLRTSDLSSIRGVTNLTGVLIERAQQDQLAEALVAELGVAWADELDSP